MLRRKSAVAKLFLRCIQAQLIAESLLLIDLQGLPIPIGATVCYSKYRATPHREPRLTNFQAALQGQHRTALSYNRKILFD
jgi:hypothetical protein